MGRRLEKHDGERTSDAAERTRYVYIERPRCPACGSANLQTIRSSDQGDGTVERRTQCRTCCHKFMIIVE